MSDEKLPISIQPFRAAEMGSTFAGALMLRDMPRLQGRLMGNVGEVEFELECGKDLESRHFVRGKLSAVLHLSCQRCLNPMSIAVDGEMLLAPVRNDQQAAQLPSQYEALLLEAGEDSVSLASLIEDELLLNIPHAPRHADTQNCRLALSAAPLNVPQQPLAQQQQPFADLKDLLAKGNRHSAPS